MPPSSEPVFIHRLRADFDVKGYGPWTAPDWLAATWAAPGDFLAATFVANAARLEIVPRSEPGRRYDLYHDAVTVHSGGTRVALRWIDREGAWAQLTYRELDARCARLAASWMAQGVEAGKVVCVAHFAGIDAFISMLAAWRLGAVPALLPPQGDEFFLRRLGKLKPDFIANGAPPHWIPAAYANGFLRSDADFLGEVPASTSYAAADPVAWCFSPLVTRPHVPRPLAAADAVLRATRDGAFLYGLEPGEHLAAPGAHPLQAQPALLLSALFCGATYVHLTIEDLEQVPGRIDEHALAAAGVDRRTRDLLMATPGRPGRSVKFWFRDPAEAIDLPTWRAFAQTLGIEDVPWSNVVIDASAGGAILGSPRRRKAMMNQNVLPVPGEPWALTHLDGSGRRTDATVGVLATGSAADLKAPPVVTPFLLAASEREWVFVGTIAPRRSGRVYPRDEIVARAMAVPGIAHASTVAIPTPGAPVAFRFVLLLFAGPIPADRAETEPDRLASEARRAIERHLGEEFLPDSIEAFPLFARERDGEVDHAWCEAQYAIAGLHRKSRGRAYALLGSLRASVVREGKVVEVG